MSQNYVPESVTPESLGISTKAILEFLKRADEQSVELHSVNLVRHDKRCLNMSFHPYSNDNAQIMFSFSKSMTSTAIGFLEQEGLISVTDKLIDIFPEFAPENPSENLKKCDVFSLLTMTCGRHNEIRNNVQFTAPIGRHSVLERPLSEAKRPPIFSRLPSLIGW